MSHRKYSGLAELLKGDPEALDYFKQLPIEMRDKIAPHGEDMDSLETLKACVQRLS